MPTKHTPGPWRIGDAGWTVFGPPNGEPAPEVIATFKSKANATLAASAPKLLGFLNALLDGGPDEAHDLLVNYGPELVAEAEGRDTL